MTYTDLRLFIGGEWTSGTSGAGSDVINPATDEVLGHVPHASTADLDMALEAARSGFQLWRQKTPVERQQVLEGAAAIIEEQKEHISRILTLEMGKTLAESRGEMDFVINIIRWYGEEGKRAYGRVVPSRAAGMQQLVLKDPVGPVASFVAWNFPGVNVIRKIAAALAAGCSIVIKASEETPGTSVEIVRAFEKAGLPPGVLNLVFGIPGEVSEHLLRSPVIRKVAFTGSTAVGIHLQKLAAETMKHTTMELGGHSPSIVFDDANFDNALQSLAIQKFRNAGQICTSVGRIYVQEGLFDRFVEGFVSYAESLKVGNGLEEGVQMGPLIAKRRVHAMESIVEDALARGAELLCGGKRIGDCGSFFQPTVFRNVPEEASLMREEVFGPVVPINSFKTYDEVLEKANRLDYGLAAYAYTSDATTALRLTRDMESGMLGINSSFIAFPETPFGGIKYSGIGSEGGVEGLEAYLHTRLVTQLEI
ncbi:NAD-dependent succinate-semialdehyde dehydrogenase [Haliea sp. E17]|uniref:NAD-dependent succinate-semialdehyde dehydrogenase n=1 Tax=Haliea sp. E17 TaxID=3401576 RepID=UPI003AB09348